jgi:hypothetical protein
MLKNSLDTLEAEMTRTLKLERAYADAWSNRPVPDDGQDFMRRLGMADVIAEEVLILILVVCDDKRIGDRDGV